MNNRLTILLIVLSAAITGCSGGKNTNNNHGGKVGNKKVIEIITNIEKKESKRPKTLSFKSSADIKSKDKTTSVRASVRMVTDSVIWISITAYGYEAVRIIATPTTLKYISRTDKKYFVGNYEFIKSKMGVEFSFFDLQSLLLAESFGVDNPAKVSKRNEKNYYVLSSLKKKEIKNIEKGKELLTPDIEVLYTNWINPETYKTEKVMLLDVNTQNSASIQYLSFENILDYMLLSSFKMNVIAENTTEITAKMSKVTVDSPLDFPFKISSKYEQIVK